MGEENKKKEPGVLEWFERWEENIKGHPKEDPGITMEEWNNMTPKEKIKFIRERRKNKNA